MSQYFTDYTDVTVGSQPPDTTVKRAASANTYSVRSVAGANVLRYLETTGSAVARGLSYDLVPSSGVTEVFFEVGDPDDSSPSSARIVVFASDNPDTEYGVIFSGPQGREYTIYKRVSGAYTSLEDATEFATAAYFNARFRVTPGSPNRLQARFWVSGSTEPTTWTLDVTDTLAISDGWTGHIGFAINDNVYFNSLGVGTDGQPAPASAGDIEAPTPAVTTTDTLQPGEDFTLTANNFSSPPVSPATFTDSAGNSITVPVTISGSGPYTAVGTMPTIAEAVTAGTSLLFGDVTIELTT
jgi:hypothetical protein